MKPFPHNNGSNNTLLGGFAVLQRNSYLSFEFFSRKRVARIGMNYVIFLPRTDRNAKFSTDSGELRKSWGPGPS